MKSFKACNRSFEENCLPLGKDTCRQAIFVLQEILVLFRECQFSPLLYSLSTEQPWKDKQQMHRSEVKSSRPRKKTVQRLLAGDSWFCCLFYPSVFFMVCSGVHEVLIYSVHHSAAGQLTPDYNANITIYITHYISQGYLHPVLAQLQARCETSHALPGPKARDPGTHTRRQASVRWKSKLRDQKDDSHFWAGWQRPIWTEYTLDRSPDPCHMPRVRLLLCTVIRAVFLGIVAAKPAYVCVCGGMGTCMLPEFYFLHG